MKHYTVLTLVDTARAVEGLPSIGTGDESAEATGTDGESAPAPAPQSAHDEVHSGATRRDEGAQDNATPNAGEDARSEGYATECDDTRRGAMERVTRFELATFSLGSTVQNGGTAP